MKEKLTEELVEARGLEAYYLAKYNNAFFFDGKWEAMLLKEKARIAEILTQIRQLE